MKTFIALCLVAFVACESLDMVHPNQHLIDEPEDTLTQKSSRIINGDTAQISDFPWQASLRVGTSHICGAAVVSARVAITAAHCVEEGNRYTFEVGTSRRNFGTAFDVASVTKHPDYSGTTSGFPNDIAILTFDQDITGTNLAEVAPLPTNDNFVGSSCDITGWGLTSSNGALPDVLQKASTTVLSYSQCRSLWGSSISTSHVCVYTGSNGACNGDSGGPLTCDGILVGVTSWGRTGCLTSYPSVYTRISSYLSWINGFIE